VLKYSFSQRLRQAIATIPGAGALYRGLRLVFAPTYREDGLVTINNADFLRDASFVRAYEAALRQQPDTWIRWRSHVVQWAAHHAMRLEGDFVECGVNRAFLSISAMTAVDFRRATNRCFYLFDTYCGLAPEQVSAHDKAAFRNVYTDTYDYVRETFREWPNVAVVRGVVPESLSTVTIERVAYLSIDMNCVKPEIDAMEFFWPRMAPGSVIILDDYGFPGHEAQKLAADGFAETVGVKVLSLPTGQGLIFK
jgi:O-methyltransferase